MERPNTVQDWSTNIPAVTSKTVQDLCNGITDKKVAGEGHNGNNTHTHTHIYSGKVNGTIQLQVAFVVVRAMNRNALDFKAVDNRICI